MDGHPRVIVMPVDVFAPLADLEGVGSAARAARDAVDALLRDRGLRRVGPEVTAESLLRGAHASAVLSGSTATLEDVRRAAGTAVPGPGPGDLERLDPFLAGAVRMTTELMSMTRQSERAPVQVWARMHQLAAHAMVTDTGQLGHIRTDDEPLPDDIEGLPPAPPAAEAWERLSSLASALTRPTQASAILVAAVVHAEIAVLRPFGVANGLVARAAERVVLVARGIDPVGACVPEAGHLELRGSYADGLRRYATGGGAGVRDWLRRSCEVVALGAERSPLNPG
jgi:Fic family protein